MLFLKSALTLILALAFQLVQVMPTAAVSAPCQVTACCCGGARTCACAKEGKQEPKPLPATPGSSLKVSPMSPVETRVQLETAHAASLPATVVAAPLTGLSAGYRGVSLAVAFCSFVM